MYVNAEIKNICLFWKYEELNEDININLTAKMVQHKNVLRTHLLLNLKAKGLLQRFFAFWCPKG